MAVVAAADGASLAGGEEFLVTAGGAESNVAVHLAALGHETYWLSRLGDDPLGDRILQFVSDRGVDASMVERDPSFKTGVYFKDRVAGGSTQVYYYRAGSAASHM